MLYGFLREGGPNKIAEDFGHILLGLLPIDLLLWVREFTDWKLPWLFKGQWPPGRPFWVRFGAFQNEVHGAFGWHQVADEVARTPVDEHVTQMSSVSDIARDQLGYAIGQQLRVCLLVGLLWWRW